MVFPQTLFLLSQANRGSAIFGESRAAADKLMHCIVKAE
jgi:hypothetical protein